VQIDKETINNTNFDGLLKAQTINTDYTFLGYTKHEKSINNISVASFSKEITFVKRKLEEIVMPRDE
jgi:hypothetical protein